MSWRWKWRNFLPADSEEMSHRRRALPYSDLLYPGWAGVASDARGWRCVRSASSTNAKLHLVWSGHRRHRVRWVARASKRPKAVRARGPLQYPKPHAAFPPANHHWMGELCA